jgi:DNA repair protein RadA/Sms
MGQCPSCKAWNTLAEKKIAPEPKHTNHKRAGYAGGEVGNLPACKINEADEVPLVRHLSGISEFDRVVGGGMVAGSSLLLSGDPGAGKTTLLSGLIGRLSMQFPTLYATAEESLAQFKDRAIKRLKVEHTPENFNLLNSSSVDHIIQQAIDLNVKFLVVDSIQAVYGDFTGDSGGVSQVKGCAKQFNQFAKEHGVTVILVGHVNKNNETAGPQQLNHIVDGNFHIEVNDNGVRTIRGSKNRFGDTENIGLFQMTEQGMIGIDNPSKIFLSSSISSPGSAVTCIRDGNRNLLLEVQSLTNEKEGDHPTKVSIGIHMNRLKLVMAVLRKHAKIKINHDTYLSLVGGLKLPETDPSADLSIAAALISSLTDKSIQEKSCFFGEISLSGEIRPVPMGVQRVAEAIKHGFKTIYVPKANFHPKMKSEGVTICPILSVGDLAEALK